MYANGEGGAFVEHNPESAVVTSIQGDGTSSVVTSIESETIIDGFHITGGTGYRDIYIAEGVAIHGGGIYCVGGGIRIRNNIIEGNDIRHPGSPDLTGNGGGIYVDDCEYFHLNNNIIRNNYGGRGAGVAALNVNGASIHNNIIQGNVGISDHGGGLYLSGDLDIYENIIENNEIGRDLGWGWGGGIIVFGLNTNAVFSQNIIRHNYSPNSGTGIYIDEAARADLYHDLIYKNEGETGAAAVDGGEDGESSLSLTNCTIADNQGRADLAGQGLLLGSLARASVLNCIVWGNGGDVLMNSILEHSPFNTPILKSRSQVPAISQAIRYSPILKITIIICNPQAGDGIPSPMNGF